MPIDRWGYPIIDDAEKRGSFLLDLQHIEQQVNQALQELITAAGLEPGQIIVVGCSTSEIGGHKIGQNSSLEIADAVINGLMHLIEQQGLFLAVQGCEHINRSLVVERACARAYQLEEVLVFPHQKAGGALAARCMERFNDPVVVERISAHAGLDIGDTFIGMHLRPVAVPVRPTQNQIGYAHLTMARTRLRYIGGPRSLYKD